MPFMGLRSTKFGRLSWFESSLSPHPRNLHKCVTTFIKQIIDADPFGRLIVDCLLRAPCRTSHSIFNMQGLLILWLLISGLRLIGLKSSTSLALVVDGRYFR